MAKILSKFGEQQPVMVNYACGFNQSDISNTKDRVDHIYKYLEESTSVFGNADTVLSA